MVYRLLPSEIKIQYGTQSYVVSLTADPNGFYVKSPIDGKLIDVDPVIQVKLFGAENNADLVDKSFLSGDRGSHNWERIIAVAMSRNMGLNCTVGDLHGRNLVRQQTNCLVPIIGRV